MLQSKCFSAWLIGFNGSTIKFTALLFGCNPMEKMAKVRSVQGWKGGFAVLTIDVAPSIKNQSLFLFFNQSSTGCASTGSTGLITSSSSIMRWPGGIWESHECEMLLPLLNWDRVSLFNWSKCHSSTGCSSNNSTCCMSSSSSSSSSSLGRQGPGRLWESNECKLLLPLLKAEIVLSFNWSKIPCSTGRSSTNSTGCMTSLSLESQSPWVESVSTRPGRLSELHECNEVLLPSLKLEKVLWSHWFHCLSFFPMVASKGFGWTGELTLAFFGEQASASRSRSKSVLGSESESETNGTRPKHSLIELSGIESDRMDLKMDTSDHGHGKKEEQLKLWRLFTNYASLKPVNSTFMSKFSWAMLSQVSQSCAPK